MEDLQREFIPYPLALRLKELGFDEPCFGWYGNENKLIISGNYKNSTHTIHYCVSSPTFSQAFRWFREKYNFHVRFLEPYKNLNTPDDKWRSSIHNMNRLFRGYTNGRYIIGNTYEEAELACLEKLIEIVENK